MIILSVGKICLLQNYAARLQVLCCKPNPCTVLIVPYNNPLKLSDEWLSYSSFTKRTPVLFLCWLGQHVNVGLKLSLLLVGAVQMPAVKRESLTWTFVHFTFWNTCLFFSTATLTSVSCSEAKALAKSSHNTVKSLFCYRTDLMSWVIAPVCSRQPDTLSLFPFSTDVWMYLA